MKKLIEKIFPKEKAVLLDDILGIHILEQEILALQFRKNEKGTIRPVFISRDTLPAGTILNGEMVRTESLEENLRFIRKKTRTHYARLALSGVDTIHPNLIRQYESSLLKTGFKMLEIIPQSESFARLFSDRLKQIQYIVMIGKYETFLFVSLDGIVTHSHKFSTGDDDCINVVRKELGVEYEQARRLKEKHGLVVSEDEARMVNGFSMIFDPIIAQIKEFDAHFEKGLQRETILLGEGANFPGIDEYFLGKMGIFAKVPLVWDKIFDIKEYIPEISFGNALSFGGVCGLFVSPAGIEPASRA